MQADWQEVWHSPQPPSFKLFFISLVAIVLILFIVIFSFTVIFQINFSTQSAGVSINASLKTLLNGLFKASANLMVAVNLKALPKSLNLIVKLKLGTRFRISHARFMADVPKLV